MKKLFAFAALTICLVGCGTDVPTLENECRPQDPTLMGSMYKTLNECKDKYIAKLKMENAVLRNERDVYNAYKLENEKIKHDIEILKIRIGYECKNMDVK
jgi:hypothetical protein